MFNQIHHVAIICSDYERSKKFYAEILGLAIVRETYRQDRDSWKLDLKVGSSEIELFSFPCPPKRPTSPEARGLRHIAFTVDGIHDAVNELNKKGIATELIREDAGGKRFTFFRDPDGLPIEIHE